MEVLERLGGPLGRHALERDTRGAAGWPSSWWTPLRVLLGLTVLTCVLGFVQKAPCLGEPFTASPYQSSYQYTRLCYSDITPLYGTEGLDHGAVPYADHPVEYPPVIGAVMLVAARAAQGLGDVTGDDSRWFFDLTALLLAGCGLVVTWAVARLAGRVRVWDAAMVALAPTLLFHAYTNWDLVAVAFAMTGLWAWSRGRPWVAGALLGLGVATKLYPVLLVLAIGLVAIPARQVLVWLRTAVAAAVAFALAYLPAVLASRSFPFPADTASCPTRPLPGWEWFWSVNTTRPPDFDSLWYSFDYWTGHYLGATGCGAPTKLNALVAAATVLVVLAVAGLVLLAPARPRVPQVAFLLVAGFLLVNKVDSPQYTLWLLPLAVLARPRWGLFLAWQAAEIVEVVARFLFFVGYPSAHTGLPQDLFLTAVLVRDALLVALVVAVVREVLLPELDVVRQAPVEAVLC